MLLLLLLLWHNKQQQLSTKRHKLSYAFTSTAMWFFEAYNKANSSTVHRKLMRKFNGCKDLHICWHFASLFLCIYAWFTSRLDQLVSKARIFILTSREPYHTGRVRFMLYILFCMLLPFNRSQFLFPHRMRAIFCSLNWTVEMQMLCMIWMFQNSVNPNSSLLYWARHQQLMLPYFFST